MDNNYKFDSSAFLYNFSTQKIFNIKNPNEAVICGNYACFGNYLNSDYYIRDSFFTEKIFENKNKYSYYSDNYDIQGENNSEIEELEIYFCQN